MIKFKIKTSIMAVLSLVIAFTVSVIVFFQYKSSKDFALLTTQTLFDKLTDQIVSKIHTFDLQSNSFIQLSQNIKNGDESANLAQSHTLFPLITNYISNNPYIYGIYLGYANDDFYIVYNLDLNNAMRSSQNAPSNARWLLKQNQKTNNNQIVENKYFYDQNFNLVAKLHSNTTYRPTQRPWYKNAIEQNQTIKTKPYIFSAIQQPGVTYAKTINPQNKTVLGLDITLSSLSEVLKNQNLVQGSGAFIFKENGDLLGQYDTITNTNSNTLHPKIKNILIKNGSVADLDKQKNVTIDGVEYFAYTTSLSSDFQSKEYIAILSPIDTIMEPYTKKIYMSLLLTLLVLFFLVFPIVYKSVQLIAKPIMLLEKENKKIASGEFDKVQRVDSFMIEISDLSESLELMSNAIQDKTQQITKLLSSFDKNVVASKTDTKGNITYVSEAFVEISGYSKEELIGANQNIVRHPDMHASLFENLWNTIERGKTFKGEIKNRKKNGGFYWVDSIITPDFDNDGNIIGYSAIRHNITDKKAVEDLTKNLEIKVEQRTAQLATEKENIEQILANILMPVLITSKNRRVIVYANSFAQELYGMDNDEILNKPLEDVYTLSNGPQRIIEQLTQTGKVYGLEEHIKTNCGKEFVGLLSVVPILYNNEECYIGMTVDITHQKNMENQIRAMHKHTRESIEYASMIQNALLPSSNVMKNYFSDYFVYWMPKDTVGGDIWQFDELRNEDECLLMIVDCTGHGVPGAFVTMIVKAIEREIVAKILDDKSMDISPAWIMGYFNQTMKILLQQTTPDSQSNAGWDGGVIYFNKKTKILKFAGAEAPLFYVDTKGQLHTIKGNRYSVGYKKCDMEYQYKETIIPIEKGMRFYCTTDGYLDQNGGEKEFPFGKKRFTKIIEANYRKPMGEQMDIFIEQMKQYEACVKDNERNDDITIIGFTI